MPDLPTLLLRHRVRWGSLWPFGNWEGLCPGGRRMTLTSSLCARVLTPLTDGLSLCSHCLTGKQKGPVPLTSSGQSLLSLGMAPMYPQHPWDLNQQIRQIQAIAQEFPDSLSPCVYPSGQLSLYFSILSLLTLHCPFFAISLSIPLCSSFSLCFLHGRFP